jgi:hypothetical protein
MGYQFCEICKTKNEKIASEQRKLSKGMRKVTIKIVGTDPLVVKKWSCKFTHFGHIEI